MSYLSVQNVSTFEHLEIDSGTQSWVRTINHCFSEDTIVENTYAPGLYITVLGQCQYSMVSRASEELSNYNYHYSKANIHEENLP